MSKIYIEDAEGASVALNLVETIRENTQYLSEIDGEVGDGDHGINMRKGFDLFFATASEKGVKSASEALKLLGETLLNEIGGSMGPLYGSFFRAMSRVVAKARRIDDQVFLELLKAGANSVIDIGGASRGDKTMLDSLLPAIDAYTAALDSHKSFVEALKIMSDTAGESALATKDMVAKMGRAARLGERSRGVRDAGATSCSLLLASMAQSLTNLLNA